MSLKKELTFLDLIVLGIAGAIGTGLLFSSAGMSALAGPSTVLAWALGGLFYLFIGLTYVELSANLPEAGGPSRYSLYSHGRFTNAINAFADLIWYLFIPPIEALAVVEGISFFYPSLITPSNIPSLSGALLGVLITLLFIPFNYFGVRFFGKTTTGIGVFKIIIYLILGIGVAAVVFRPENFSSYGGFSPYGAVGLFSAVPLAMFAFGGIRVLPDYAEETRDVKRLGKAIIWVVLGQTMIYVLFATVFIGGLDWQALGITPGNWSAVGSLPGNPFIDIASSHHASALIAMALLVGILGPFVTGYIYMGAGSRVLFAMGRSSIVSSNMKSLHERYAVPYWALIMFALVGSLVAFIAAPLPSIYGLISDSVVAGYLGFAVNPVAMAVLRRNGLTRDKIPGGNVVGPIAFASASLISYWSGWPSVPYSVLILFLAVGIFSALYRVKEDILNSLWYIGYIGFITLMSYIGSVGALNLIPFTTASLLVALLSVLLFYPLGYMQGLKRERTMAIYEDQKAKIS